jgi:uncharacterized damage-inducible protein DinB
VAEKLTDPLVELTPGPTLPVAAPIVGARTAILAALDDLLGVPDSALESLWVWRPDDPVDEADVRYGFYRIHERLEEASAATVHGRAAAGEGSGVGPAVPLFASGTAARWELRAAIAPLSDADLDRDPGGGEWSIRRTLGHTVQAQRSYGWYSAWWLDRGHAPGPLPERAGDERMPEEPDELEEAAGSPAEIMARLDDLVDVATGRFAGLTEEQLSIPVRWSGLPVNLRFRLGRWGSHIREHLIQVDKTLVMNGRPTTEVERLVGLIGASYGRLEALAFGRSEAVLSRAWPDGGSAALVLESCAGEVRALAASVAAAARA